MEQFKENQIVKLNIPYSESSTFPFVKGDLFIVIGYQPGTNLDIYALRVRNLKSNKEEGYYTHIGNKYVSSHRFTSL